MKKRKKTFKVTIIIVILLSMSSFTTMGINNQIINEKHDIIQKDIIVPDDYPTIQAAINHALMGQHIIVRRGEYEENINVNKMISIRGSGSSGTIITGDETNDVVTISVDGVSINGFTIQYSGSNHAGLRLNSHYNQIDRCIIKNNGHGIILHASSGNFIRNNSIVNNSKSGFWLYRSHANEINGNELNNNNNGMLVNFSCLGNQVKGNIFSKSDNNGLQLSQTSRSNTFIANNIKNNGDYGVKVIGSSDSNILHHNDFIHNTQNAIDTSINYWNDSATESAEGNYWSDYTGIDSDGDGIGDTPYVIPSNALTFKSVEGNKDYFPLMDSNIPTQIKIEVINQELTLHSPIEFEITYRHKYFRLNLDEEIFYQVDWDDQSSFEEDELRDKVYLTHTWNQEGIFNIRVRSFRYIVGERYNSEWFSLPIDLSEASEQGFGYFFCFNMNITPHQDEETIGYTIDVSGLGLFYPSLMLQGRITLYNGDEETVVYKKRIDPDSFFPFFIWFNEQVDEQWFAEATYCACEITLKINGNDKITETFTISS